MYRCGNEPCHRASVHRSSAGQWVFRTVGTLAVLVLAPGHILFGVANFQPGFPKLEGVAAILAGLALLAALILARRSLPRAFGIAFVGTLPLVAWFAYAVTIEKSSDPQFFWASLVLPTITGSALVLTRRRPDVRRSGGRGADA